MKTVNINKLSMVISLAVLSTVVCADSDIQTVPSGGSFTLSAPPANVTNNSTQKGIEIPIRIPIGEKNLLNLKNQSELFQTDEAKGAGTPAIKKEALAPEEQGVATPTFANTGCNVNVATGFAPSDIHGAVGPTTLVVTTNVDIGVYNRSTCTLAGSASLKNFFGTAFTIPTTQTLFDPRTIYDAQSGRFIFTAESRDSANTDQYQYIAVSMDSIGLSYYVYRITLSEGTTFFCKKAVASFWDYPSTGKSANRLFIAANDFPVTGSATAAVLAIDKIPLLTGGTLTAKCFKNLAYNLAPPLVLDAANQSVFLAPRFTLIKRYNHTKGATVAADTMVADASYPIPAWATPPGAAQPNGQKLDSLDGRFQGASIQSRDRIWNIHAVNNGGRAAIRWYRLARSASTVLNAVTFTSNATSHLFNPSFVTNSGVDGSPAFITASRTEPSAACTDPATCYAAMLTFSGINNGGASYWTQSLAGSSTAQFETDGLGKTCNNSPRGSCRWGDYSSINVDPNGAGRAWGFNQLINGTTMFDWFSKSVEEVYNLQN